jgi:ELP3 family radical SAM enzyme/protein acetyltransferase
MTTDIEDLAKLGPKIINSGEYDEFMSAINDSIEESIDNSINFQVEELDCNVTNHNGTNHNDTNDNSNKYDGTNPLDVKHLMLESEDKIKELDSDHKIELIIFRILDWCRSNNIKNSEITKNIENGYHKYCNKLLKQFNMEKKPRNVKLNYIARLMILKGKLTDQDYYLLLNITLGKKSRTQSGILQVTVVTSPGDFSCAFDCYFCPKQEGMPRSYPKEGPSMRRAAAWNFDSVKQIQGRISSYDLMGHPVYGCKSELIVLGGTWSSYSMEYRRKFITECYYAYNTYYDDKKKPMRPILTLAEEKDINTKSACRIIGLTIETRPDCITQEEIDSFMEFGITRVQIGIQHTNNKILKKINRQCTIEQCMKGIKLLKNAGFKVLVHLMPNLPGSTPEIDKDMFNMMLTDPRLSFDEVKIYPTVVPTTSDKDINKVNTVLEKWYLDGKYVPYSNDELMEMLIEVLSRFPKDKRISRLFRDIPQPNTASGGEMPHMRDVIMKEMTNRGLYCNCIRSREIKDHDYKIEDIKLEILEFEASDGKEFFISYVVPHPQIKKETLILGFCRLRLPYKKLYIGNLPDTAFIRELHVYSQMLSHQGVNSKSKSSQHKGLGRKLIDHAETIARDSNFKNIVVISGIGVRDYYRKLGYHLNDKYYMEKDLNKTWKQQIVNQYNKIICDTNHYHKFTKLSIYDFIYFYNILLGIMLLINFTSFIFQ